MQCWADFQERLSSEKRKYPVHQFRAFWAITKRYAELTRSEGSAFGFRYFRGPMGLLALRPGDSLATLTRWLRQ